MNTSLTVLPSPKMKPKPSRYEIIEAMVQLKVERLRKESAEADAIAKAARQRISEKLIKLAANLLPNARVSFGYVNNKKFTSLSVEIPISDLSLNASLRKEALQYLDLQAQSHIRIDPDRIRRDLKAHFGTATGHRVSELLSTPESRQALESALTKLESQPVLASK